MGVDVVAWIMAVVGLVAIIAFSRRVAWDKAGLDGRWIGPVCLLFALAIWQWGVTVAVLAAAFGLLAGIYIEWRKIHAFQLRVREIDAAYGASGDGHEGPAPLGSISPHDPAGAPGSS